MAYPEDQDAFRTAEDIQGLPYDADDTKTLFAKDYNDVVDAIQNIEDFVGYEGSIDESPLYLLIANLLYPVGKIIAFATGYNPNTSLGFGTWAKHGEGRVLVGQDDATFDTLDAEIGEETHQLTEAELAEHNHTQDSHNHTQDAHGHVIEGGGNSLARLDNYPQAMGGTVNIGNVADVVNPATATNQAATATNQVAGGDEAHNNIQPSIVGVRWVRTA